MSAVDVLAVMQKASDLLPAISFQTAQQLTEACADVVELVAAVAEVYGEPCSDDSNAGDDPCSPGCPSCRISAALARITGEGK